MSGDPVVSRAAMDAIERLGTSASASRLVAGQQPIHLELERALADHVGTDDARLSFVTGYLTGVTTIGHLFKPGDLIVVHDALIHNCTLNGSKLHQGLRTVPFPPTMTRMPLKRHFANYGPSTAECLDPDRGNLQYGRAISPVCHK